MNITILDKWKVIDISEKEIPKGLLEEISFFGVAYQDMGDVQENLYDAQDLIGKDDNEEIHITEEERKILEHLRFLQQENDAFYFRIVKS